jgi:diguanylate cyclase (GGDEF)-like protein
VGSAARVKQLQDALVARAVQLDEQGRTDVLTGLRNRRHAEEHLRAAVSAARRHRYALAVSLLDVDRFKAVNDEHGHGTGDAVLRSVAEALAGSARTEDLVARWGGEEFVVVPAPPPEPDGGRAMVERLRAAVGARCTTAEDGREVRVTLSAGLALAVPGPDADEGEALERLLRAADEALYEAKRGGRDRLVVVELPAR